MLSILSSLVEQIPEAPHLPHTNKDGLNIKLLCRLSDFLEEDNVWYVKEEEKKSRGFFVLEKQNVGFRRRGKGENFGEGNLCPRRREIIF